MSTSVQRARTTVALKQIVPTSKAHIIAHAKRDFLEMDENVHVSFQVFVIIGSR